MNRIWIKQPMAVYCPEDAANGLVIDNGVITELVGKGQEPSQPVDQLFDASEHVLLPGLVNCHHHFYQTLTRAFPPALDKELFNWLQTLYPVWANLTPDMVSLSSQLAMAELMLSGCTTASDHHYLFSDGLEDAIDRQVAAAHHLGMRATFTRGSMSLGRDAGGLPPQRVVQTEDAILSDSERLINTFHQSEPGAMINIALAPCSPFSVSTELMRASADLSDKHNVRLHTHLAETLDEEAFCLERFGLRTVDYLESVGWLNNRTWLAHGIHFNDEEMKRLGHAGVGISHCPSSNMILASGICRTLELEAAGCPIGLGVDGSASNDGSNLITEVRQALLIQRLRYGSSKVSHLDVLRWATKGGAKVLGRDDIGTLAVGKQADLALYKLNELRFSGSHDPLAALPLCGAERADRVMIAGKWTVIDGRIPHLDIGKLMADHRQAAKKLASS